MKPEQRKPASPKQPGAPKPADPDAAAAKPAIAKPVATKPRGSRSSGAKSSGAKSSGANAKGPQPRTASRMAAVQALYQMDMAGTDLNDVIDEFISTRFAAPETADPKTGEIMPDDTLPGETLAGADPVFFAEVLRGVVRRQRDIDPMIDDQLAAGWRLVRVDSILRAILRSGAFELIERRDVPARVAINEYINVAHAFFDEDEPKVVNGLLDKLARQLRPAEFEPEART